MNKIMQFIPIARAQEIQIILQLQQPIAKIESRSLISMLLQQGRCSPPNFSLFTLQTMLSIQKPYDLGMHRPKSAFAKIVSSFGNKLSSLQKTSLRPLNNQLQEYFRNNYEQPKQIPSSQTAQSTIKQEITLSQLFDIERGEVNTMKELDIYGQNTRSLLIYLNLQLLGVDSDEAFKAASHVGRAIGITDVIKRTKLDLIKHRTYMPTSILSKYHLNFYRIWDSRSEGHLNQNFYDVLLEVAGYAKRHLQLAREYKIDKRAARAFLLAVETQFFLDRLEQYNFDIMDDDVHRTSNFRVPYRVWKHARAGTF